MRLCYVSIILIILKCGEPSYVDIDKIFKILLGSNYPKVQRHGKDILNNDLLILGRNIHIERRFDGAEIFRKKINNVLNESGEMIKEMASKRAESREKIKKRVEKKPRKRSRPKYPKSLREMYRNKPKLRSRTDQNHTQVITTIFCPFFGVMKMKSKVKHQDFEGL